MELSIRGILRGFGLKVGPVTRKNFEADALFGMDASTRHAP